MRAYLKNEIRSYILHKGLYLNQLWSFCYPLAAQEFSAFPLLNVTQAFIYYANAKLFLRNTLDFNSYSGGNIFTSAP
jgi:hypothetical protein